MPQPGNALTPLEAGIDFVLLSPPHYSQPTEEDIYLHHKYVNDRVDIGIMTYNSFWVMPGGYSYSPALFEKLADLDNVVGVKWTGTSTEDYLGFQQMFGDRFALSENRQFFGMGARFGMKSRIDVMANAAPRLSLHQTKLTQEGRYDELEALYRQLQFDPTYRQGRRRVAAPMVADGPHARMLAPPLGPRDRPVLPRSGRAATGVRRLLARVNRDQRRPRLGRLGPVSAGLARQ